MPFTLLHRGQGRAHAQFMLGGEGEERLLILARASFAVEGAGITATAAPEFSLWDKYRGDPATSSMVTANDLALTKSRVDLLLTGSAYPPRQGDAAGFVSFSVGSWSKEALVFGERCWRSSFGGLRPSSPEPFEAIPLVYERAFGGSLLEASPPVWSPENPVGVGLVTESGEHDGTPLPNLEHPRRRLSEPGDRPPPCAFGPIAPHWEPRRSAGGTFDAAWQRERAPLPPRDADPRAAQCAPPDQWYPTALRGDEPVEVRGVCPGGERLSFRLPGLTVDVTVQDGHGRRRLPAMLDTLHLDAEARRVDLTWRASLPLHEHPDELAWVLVEERSLGASHG